MHPGSRLVVNYYAIIHGASHNRRAEESCSDADCSIPLSSLLACWPKMAQATTLRRQSVTAKGTFEAKMRLGSQSARPRAPDRALARGSLTPRCALEASRNAKSGTDKGEFERKARKGSPRESRGGTRPWAGDLVKQHFSKKMSFPCRRQLDPTIWPKRTQRKV